MADKTVKIVRRGRAHIHLVVCDLRHGADIVADFAGDGCRLLQCRPLGHINDDLEFALVVKGQHLDPNNLEGEERKGCQEQNDHKDEKPVAPERGMDEGSHDPAIELCAPTLCPMAGFSLLFEEAKACPRRHDKGHDQGEEHCRRGSYRNRPHVRAHQSPHKGHGDDGGDHREGGQDRRVPDFVDSLDCHFENRSVSVFRQSIMTDDVFDDNDGIIHQDTDGKDQGKECDAVKRIAIKVEKGQGEGQRDRDGDGDDARFPQSQGHHDQDRHRDNGDQHVKEQFIRFLFRRLSVVTRHRHREHRSGS